MLLFLELIDYETPIDWHSGLSLLVGAYRDRDVSTHN